MTEAEIISGVVDREGGYVADNKDKGGPTKYGITAATLGAWRGYGHPASPQQVLELEPWEAEAIYRTEFILAPGFVVANIPYEPLRTQLIDFGVNSGPARAIRWLQRVIGVPVTGRMDLVTVGWLRNASIEHVNGRQIDALVNDALVASRAYMIDQATDSGAVDKKFEEGLESRALGFFLARP